MGVECTKCHQNYLFEMYYYITYIDHKEPRKVLCYWCFFKDSNLKLDHINFIKAGLNLPDQLDLGGNPLHV